MTTLIAFIVLLSILVVIHEGGHYIVLRLCGVHVDRFSVGMGPVIFSKKDKKGTEFAISALPLGGYVSYLSKKALDIDPELKSKFTKEQLDNLFETKPKWQRALVMFAGPLANFILAVVIFTFIFASQPTLQTVFLVSNDEVITSPNIQIDNNDELVAVGRENVENPTDLRLALLSKTGYSGSLEFKFKSSKTKEVYVSYFDVIDFLSTPEEQETPEKYLPFNLDIQISPVVGRVEQGKPAFVSGLTEGDEIVSIDGKNVFHFSQISQLIESSNKDKLMISYIRNNTLYSSELSLEYDENGKLIDKIGVSAYFSRSFTNSFAKAVHDTYNLSIKTLLFIGKMISGNMGTDNLSGPVGIAKMSGEAASAGVLPFLYLMAILSISLGVLNLLPIPVLDGGHLTMLAYEAVVGKPLPERIEAFAYNVGGILLLLIIVFAVFNDISRWLS